MMNKKNTGRARSIQEADYIVHMADYHQQRTGQFLFNNLKHEIAEIVRGSLFDPFYKSLSEHEVVEWLEHHIIYSDDGIMICLFDGDHILWEEE
jgi:hypothetical protein